MANIPRCRSPIPRLTRKLPLSHAEGLTRLDRALAALPVELRECLVLRELEELSYKEIGHITGVPIGTVMSRLWRARRAMPQVETEGGCHGGR